MKKMKSTMSRRVEKDDEVEKVDEVEKAEKVKKVEEETEKTKAKEDKIYYILKKIFNYILVIY